MEYGKTGVTISERMRQDAVAADAWHETHGEMASAASTLNGYAKEVEDLEKENKRLKEHLEYRHEVILRGDPKEYTVAQLCKWLETEDDINPKVSEQMACAVSKKLKALDAELKKARNIIIQRDDMIKELQRELEKVKKK